MTDEWTAWDTNIDKYNALEKYIENMFESNITNGLIEGLNNKIKSIKRTAFGYSNFSNFKKRVFDSSRYYP